MTVIPINVSPDEMKALTDAMDRLDIEDIASACHAILERAVREEDAKEAVKDQDRKGHYMHTFTGRHYWPLDPRAEDVDLADIAHHLGMKCRYAGATRNFYSVAEHSVYVALMLSLMGMSDQVVLAGLLHDASEAYNGDLIRPLKYDPVFAQPFKTVEALNDAVIATAFNLPQPLPRSVKFADEAVTEAELRQVINGVSKARLVEGGDEPARVPPAPFDIACWSPTQAREMFLALHDRITHGTTPRTVSEIHHFLSTS